MGKTHFTDGLNCYTITNNYMEKNGLRVSHGKNPFHRRIKLLYRVVFTLRHRRHAGGRRQ